MATFTKGSVISTATASDFDCSANLAEDHPYKKLLQDALAADDADLERYQCVVQGASRDGVPILFFAPRLGFANDINLPSAQKDRELKRMLLHFIKKANSVVTGPFIMIYGHTPLTILSQQPIIYKYYKMLPREYKKNLLHLYIVHPNFLMRSFFEIGVRWFVSDKFYKKLHFINNIAELQHAVGVRGMPLPPLWVQNEDEDNDYMSEKFIESARKKEAKGAALQAMSVPAKAGGGAIMDKNGAAPGKVNFSPSILDSFVPQLGTTGLIDRCCHFIRANPEGLKRNGIFRLSGDNVVLSAVKRRLGSANREHLQCIYIGVDDPRLAENRGSSGAPSTSSTGFVPASVIVTDVDTVTNILKVSLRMLADPLIPAAQYSALIEATQHFNSDKNEEAWQGALSTIEASLPEEHAKTLDHLLLFLSEITLESEANKMDGENLARIFSPTLFQQHLDSKEGADPMVVFAEVNMGAKVIKKMIEMRVAAKHESLRTGLNQKMMNRLTLSGGLRNRAKSDIERSIQCDESSSEEEA
jgi:hypothetical protein